MSYLGGDAAGGIQVSLIGVDVGCKQFEVCFVKQSINELVVFKLLS